MFIEKQYELFSNHVLTVAQQLGIPKEDVYTCGNDGGITSIVGDIKTITHLRFIPDITTTPELYGKVSVTVVYRTLDNKWLTPIDYTTNKVVDVNDLLTHLKTVLNQSESVVFIKGEVSNIDGEKLSLEEFECVLNDVKVITFKDGCVLSNLIDNSVVRCKDFSTVLLERVNALGNDSIKYIEPTHINEYLTDVECGRIFKQQWGNEDGVVPNNLITLTRVNGWWFLVYTLNGDVKTKTLVRNYLDYTSGRYLSVYSKAIKKIDEAIQEIANNHNEHLRDRVLGDLHEYLTGKGLVVRKCGCLVYSNLVAIDVIDVNGELTIGVSYNLDRDENPCYEHLTDFESVYNHLVRVRDRTTLRIETISEKYGVEVFIGNDDYLWSISGVDFEMYVKHKSLEYNNLYVAEVHCDNVWYTGAEYTKYISNHDDVNALNDWVCTILDNLTN